MATLPVLSFGSVQLPLDTAFPSFARTTQDLDEETRRAQGDGATLQWDLTDLVRAVLKAKRIAFVTGAGISCASGIPDFRSSEGLFEQLKKQHPEARLSSGKDLFDASLFSSEGNAAIYYKMIAELSLMSDKAEPTAFHRLLKTLDDEGKLFRVYTQNIDGLESRAGLSYGLGNSVPPTSPSKSKSKSAPTPSPSPSPRKTAASLVPRCIPLHGHLATLSCPSCSLTLPLPPYVPLLASGTSPACPRCLENEQARAILGERSRGVGRMKPDVVLYGEPHKEGERVGEILRKDLGGKRPDLLIVVGTSLKVPGTRMLVREMGKVIRPSPIDGEDEEDEDDDAYEMPPASGSTSLSSQPSSQQARGSKKSKAKKQIHTIYLNFDFPTPAKEFQSTFDVWARGDVQEFVQAVEEEREAQEEKKESRRLEKLRASERKVQRERVKVEKERKVEEGKGKGKEEERISPSKAFPRAATAINRSSPPKLVYAANPPPSLPKSAIQTRRTSSLSPTPPALPPVGPFTRALPSPSPAPSIPLPFVDPTPSQRHNLAKLASPHVSISPEPRQRPLSQSRSRSPVTLPSIRRTRSSISPSDSSTTERPAKRSRRSSVDPPTTTNTPTPTLEPRRTRSSISPASSDLSDARSSSPAIYTSNEKRFSVDVEVKKKVVVRGGKLGFRVGKPGVEGSRYKK